MKRHRLSIVVCSYQQAAFLRQALASLTEQRDVAPDELEILVVDGGSTDGSVEIIREFESRLAWWVSEPDRGQTHALKKGFARASGDILGWLCSDDLLEPGAAREILDLFGNRPQVRFCYGDARRIDAHGVVIKSKREIPFNWFIWKYDHNYVPQPSAFWRRELYDVVGGLDERYDLAMDGDLFARFAASTRPVHVPSYWSSIRVYPQQKTLSQKDESRREMREICQRHGARLQSAAALTAAYVLAKGLRVTWKLATNCYRP